MAKKYEKQNNVGLRILCAVLALILIAACTLGGLELWGTDKMKPSNWGKDDLAPVAISFSDGLKNSTRVYSLTAVSDKFPSTKRATATCALPEGGAPDSYEWELTGGEGLSMKTVASDGSIAEITARQYFNGSATLTARAYKNGELRGIGSIGVRAPEPLPITLTLIGYATQYDYNSAQFKEKIVDLLPSEYKTSLKEYTINPEDDLNGLITGISFAQTENNIVIFFDDCGLIAEHSSGAFEYLTGKEIPFIVIDDMPYAADTVNAAGGVYFTATEYDAYDAQYALDEIGVYGQAIYYADPDAPQTAFDVFVETLFGGEAQACTDWEEYNNTVAEYQGNGDGLIICVPDAEDLWTYLTPIGDLSNVTFIIGNYFSNDHDDPAEAFRTDYGIENAIVYQRQINEGYGGIDTFINTLLNLYPGAKPNNITPYDHVRILPPQ